MRRITVSMFDESLLVFACLFMNAIWAPVAGTIYKQKGRSTGLGLLAGATLGLLGVILVLALPADPAGQERVKLATGYYQRCYSCQSLIHFAAVVCPYCTSNPEEVV